MSVVVITDEAREVEGETRDAGLFVAAEALRRATGWVLKPEGLCRDDVCVPLRDGVVAGDDGAVDLAAMGAALGHPTVVDAAEGVAAMTEPAAGRAAALSALVATDFTLPDLEENPVSLSDFTGKKKLLVAWASW